MVTQWRAQMCVYISTSEKKLYHRTHGQFLRRSFWTKLLRKTRAERESWLLLHDSSGMSAWCVVANDWFLHARIQSLAVSVIITRPNKTTPLISLPGWGYHSSQGRVTRPYFKTQVLVSVPPFFASHFLMWDALQSSSRPWLIPNYGAAWGGRVEAEELASPLHWLI